MPTDVTFTRFFADLPDPRVVIGTTKGSAIGIRKGNTVAQPLRVALPPPQGDEDAHGGPVRPHSSAPP